MNALTNIQIITGTDGKPAYVVIPYQDYIAQQSMDRKLIPHAVVSRTVDGATPVRAWREHLGLTQTEVARRLGISQSAYAQQENSDRPRKASLMNIAKALGLVLEQLDV